MEEQCDFCGRFGARSGKYLKLRGIKRHANELMTLYLCSRCDKEQREKDAQWLRKESEERNGSSMEA